MFKLARSAIACALLTATALAPLAHAEVSLNPNEYLFRCPFYKGGDAYDFQGIVAAVKESLKDKLTKREACRAPLNQLLQSLETSQSVFSNLTEDDKQRVHLELRNRYETELAAQIAQSSALASSATTPEDKAFYQAQGQSLWAALQASQKDQLERNGAYAEQKSSLENSLRSRFYDSFNDSISVLRNMDAGCLEVAGGTKTLVPALIQLSSMATGYSGFSTSSILQPVIKLIGNLASLLIDSKVRNAMNQVEKFQNDQIIACTYYALKYSACEYKLAYGLAKDTDRIKELLRNKVRADEFEEFYRLELFKSERLPNYAGVFDAIATGGTTLSLSTTLLVQYIEALKIDPDRLPLPPVSPPTAPAKFNADERRQAQGWLQTIASRGISVSTFENSQPVPIERQVESAMLLIQSTKDTLEAVKERIQATVSFTDLRSRLDTQYPALYRNIQTDIEFLQGFEDPSSKRISSRMKLTLTEALDLLIRIRDFLAVDVEKLPVVIPPKPLPPGWVAPSLAEQYRDEVNKKGALLFDTMARGAIAQIERQNVIVIANAGKDRLRRAALLLENRFLQEDDLFKREIDNSYGFFRVTRAAYSNILTNYQAFSGTGKAMRIEGYEQTLKAFEKGFGKEILRMIERAGNKDSTLFADIPELRGASLPHLCSLFASSLPNIRGGERALRHCKANASEIEQLKIIDDQPLKIDYANACFYHGYNKRLEMQGSMLRTQQFINLRY